MRVNFNAFDFHPEVEIDSAEIDTHLSRQIKWSLSIILFDHFTLAARNIGPMLVQCVVCRLNHYAIVKRCLLRDQSIDGIH